MDPTEPTWKTNTPKHLTESETATLMRRKKKELVQVICAVAYSNRALAIHAQLLTEEVERLKDDVNGKHKPQPRPKGAIQILRERLDKMERERDKARAMCQRLLMTERVD